MIPVGMRVVLGKIKQELGIPESQQPDFQTMVRLCDEYGNPIVDNGDFIYSRELIYSVTGKTDAQGNPIHQVVIQDHSYGHFYSSGSGNQLSHLNVRPDTNTGRVSGMKDHYYFKYRNRK